MNAYIFLRLFLVLHLTGMTFMVGHTIADFVLFLSFTKKFTMEREKSLTVLELMKKLSLLLMVGAVLLILSGTGLLFITQGVFAGQLWFQIKIGLIIILILNGTFIGGGLQEKLKHRLSNGRTEDNNRIDVIRQRLRLFYIIQSLLFLVIIILAVFKFT